MRYHGRDVLDLQPLWFRGQIAVVRQEPILFPRSVRDNVIYGCTESPPDSQIEAVLRATQCDFVTDLTEGLDTMVDTALLSGGQKQRSYTPAGGTVECLTVCCG